MAPTNMNTRQARVVDPILTTQVRGYTNAQFIFPELFPYADIPVRGMRVVRFGQEAFRRESTRRAPGADVAAITVGYESDPVTLAQDALDAVVPREYSEEAGAVPGIDVASMAVQQVLDKVDLGYEIDCANLALNPANYAAKGKTALAGGDLWSNPTAKILTQMKDFKSDFAKRIGRQPNVLVMGLDEINALTENDNVKEQFKYTSGDSITVDMVARYLQLDKIVVGEAIHLPDGAADGEGELIWKGGALLAYVNRGGSPTAKVAASSSATASYLAPSFGYSYRLRGYPIVEQPYWNQSRRSWLYGVTQERQAVAAMPDAGFLIQNPLGV
ncbi:MAG: major capsid protein [Hyphomicrobiales bacterium]|nr:major capsid protein [Hyphomicrobiales bacterium]